MKKKQIKKEGARHWKTNKRRGIKKGAPSLDFFSAAFSFGFFLALKKGQGSLLF